MRRLLTWLAVLACVPAGTAGAQTKSFEITITADKHDYKDTPVCVPLSVPKELAQVLEAPLNGSDAVWRSISQLTAPGITTEHVKASAPDLVRRDLHFVITSLKAGATAKVKCVLDPKTGRTRTSFLAWKDTKGEHADLYIENGLGDIHNHVLRYVYPAYDDSSVDKRNRTYKVFHHLYDPDKYSVVGAPDKNPPVTNGGWTNEPLGDPKKLLYPHHRGLQYGFNKITYDGQKADTWHCPKDDHQSHEGFVLVEDGPLLGRHRVRVDWHGAKKEVFAKEEREVTAYWVPSGTLVEFASRLIPTVAKVKLDGDPQHAGFQFRAHNDVAVHTAKQTYYLRPDGKDEPGKTRNWDPKTKEGPTDLPWDVMSFVLDGKRYSVEYMDHPKNPHPARYSERDYGRFGCYFEHELTASSPLVVDYRIWLQRGEVTVQAQALSTAFTTPPKVTVK